MCRLRRHGSTSNGATGIEYLHAHVTEIRLEPLRELVSAGLETEGAAPVMSGPHARSRDEGHDLGRFLLEHFGKVRELELRGQVHLDADSRAVVSHQLHQAP